MKKYLWLLLIPVLLIATTACNSNTKKVDKEKIVLEDKKLGFKTTFYYEKGKKYKNIEADNNSGASAALTFDNEDLDLSFKMYYNTIRKGTYDDSQKIRSNQKYYKKYKFGDYDAYVYGEYDSSINLNILLDVEDNDMANSLFVSITRIDSDPDVVVSKVVDSKEVQELFNSMKYEKESAE